jgi:hypothetical protein
MYLEFSLFYLHCKLIILTVKLNVLQVRFEVLNVTNMKMKEAVSSLEMTVSMYQVTDC